MKLNLKTRMLLTIVGSLTLVLAILAVSVSTLSYNTSMNLSEKFVAEQMKKEGLELSRFFDKHLYATQAMVSSVKIIKEGGQLNREDVNNILINVLKDQPEAVDAWFVWEPNAFDGQDATNKGNFDADEAGRFVPLAYRDGDKYLIDKCYAYDTDPYYLTPKETLKPFITPPTVYVIGGVDVNMVTISVPIVIDGKFYGVGGIDIAVDTLLNNISSIKLFDTGFIKVVGAEGLTYAHINPDNLSKVAEEFASASDPTLVDEAKIKPLRDGQTYSGTMFSSTLNENAYKLFIPFEVSSFGPTWIIGATIPISEMTKEASNIRNINFITSMAGLLIIGTISFVYINLITKWIGKIAVSAKAISNGDLVTPIDPAMTKRSDEIGILAKSFEHMKEELRSIASRIISTAHDMTESSEMLSEASSQSAITSEDIARAIEEIARGATDQAQDTEKGSTEVMNLGYIIEENLKDIDELSQSAKNVIVVVHAGTESMSGLDAQARRTESEIEAMTGNIQSTYNSVNRIKEVSSFIASISEQTNLLALNASIEAARAGEHGRGFAVVADEIRKLAEQSKNSTMDIDQALKLLNDNAEKLVSVAKEIKFVIAEQKDGVDNASAQFSTIRVAIDEIVNKIETLDRAGASMLEKKTHIMEVVTNLSAIAQENAASTEETSASTEEQTANIIEISKKSQQLAELATTLKQASTYFKI